MANHNNPIDSTVQQLVKDLHALFNDRLISVCIYGSSLFKEETLQLKPKHRDINVLVILDAVSPLDLERAAGISKIWLKTANALPIFFSQAEWQASDDVFALEYADIRDNHAIAYGTDLFSDVEVDCHSLRLVCELELDRKLIFLRQRLLSHQDSPKVLLEIMQSSVNSIAAIFRGVLRLSDTTQTVPQKPAEVFQRIARTVTPLDPAVFGRILDSKTGTKIVATDVLPLYRGYLESISHVIAYVDQFLPLNTLEGASL